MPEPPSPLLRDARQFPTETLRLLSDLGAELTAMGADWAEFVTDQRRSQVRQGTFRGAIWPASSGAAQALAGWQESGTVGRRGWIYLARGHQDGPTLERMLRWLESDGGARFVSWSDQIPGVPDPDREGLFRARGFTAVERAEMRLPAAVTIAERPIELGLAFRTLSPADEASVAQLLQRVYHGELEQALFTSTGSEPEDARVLVHDIFHGGVGRWLAGASFGAEHDGELVGCTLANEFVGGLISEVGVDPAFRRRGLGRAMLARTTRQLRKAGFVEPRLLVTMWNERAVRLYRGVGFEFTVGGAERIWMDLPALGVAHSGPAQRRSRRGSISPD